MKKTRLFKHFITLIHCCALSIPLFTLIGTFVFNYLAPAAYFASHKNGNNSSYEINYKYQSNEVNSADDLVEGNIYNFNISNDTIDNYFTYGQDQKYIEMIFIKIDKFNFINYELDIDEYVNFGRDFIYPLRLVIYEDYSIMFYFPWSINNEDILSLYSSTLLNDNIFELVGIFKLVYNDLNYVNLPITYTNYNEIESVEIENHNDFEDMKNYQPKTFDDACFYTMQSLGAFKYEGDSLDDMLDSHYNYDLDDVLDLYLGFDDLTTPTYRTGVVNYDWFDLFNVNGAIKDNQSSWLFFVNYYINYFINISIICFMPIVIMCFFKMCTNLVLKFTEKGDY